MQAVCPCWRALAPPERVGVNALKANKEAWTLPGRQSRVSAGNLGQGDKARSAFSNDPSSISAGVGLDRVMELGQA